MCHKNMRSPHLLVIDGVTLPVSLWNFVDPACVLEGAVYEFSILVGQAHLEGCFYTG